MKRLICILFFFCLLRASAIIPTNELNLIINTTSYGSAQFSWPSFVWVPLYHNAYYACMYPQWTNRMYSIGQSGSSFTNDLLHDVEQAWQVPVNSFKLPGYSMQMPNDNGGDGSNACYANLALMVQFTNNSFNGTAYTNQQLSFQNIQTVSLSGYPDGDNTPASLALGRSQASDKKNAEWGNPSVDLWHAVKTNSLDQDPDFRPFAGGHPSAWGAFFTAAVFVHDTGYETNGVGALTLNYDDLSSNLDHCTISGVFKSSSQVTITNVLWARMAPAFDVLFTNTATGDTTTNDASIAFTKYPPLLNWFPWIVSVQNLPTGNWNLAIDGVSVATMSAAQWAVGFNQLTNYAGPLFLQRQAVLMAIRDQMGVNHTNNIAHSAGTALGDMVNLGSNEFSNYSAGTRGSAFVASVASFMSSVRNTWDQKTWAAAQQTNHTYTLLNTSPAVARYVNARIR